MISTPASVLTIDENMVYMYTEYAIHVYFLQLEQGSIIRVSGSIRWIDLQDLVGLVYQSLCMELFDPCYEIIVCFQIHVVREIMSDTLFESR